MTNPTPDAPPSPTPPPAAEKRSRVPRLFDSETGRSLLLLAIATVLAFLGLQRLATYDDALDGIRKSTEERYLEERKLAIEQQQNLTTNLESQFQNFSNGLRPIAQDIMYSVIEEEKIKLDIRQEQFKTDTDQIVANIDARLEPFRWLEAYQHRAASLTGIKSISIAHEQVTERLQEGRIDTALTIAEHAVSKRLPGGSDEYFNLSTSMAQVGQDPVAADIVDLGLKHYPTSVDLISQGINASAKAGRRGRAEELLSLLRKIPKERWSWRAFVFGGEFLMSTGREKEGLNMYEAFRQHIPEDERGYSFPGEYFRQLGRFQEALRILEQGSQKIPRSAQTNFLLAQTYTAVGEYEEAVSAASRAIAANSESQPTVSQAASLWARATALDSLIHQEIDRLNESGNGINNVGKFLSSIQQCVSDYRLASRLSDTLKFYGLRGAERIDILRELVVQAGVRAEKVEEIFGTQGIEELAKMLQEVMQEGGAGPSVE